MEEYTQEVLQRRYIHPSASPAFAGFFFFICQKKVWRIQIMHRLQSFEPNHCQIPQSLKEAVKFTSVVPTTWSVVKKEMNGRWLLAPLVDTMSIWSGLKGYLVLPKSHTLCASGHVGEVHNHLYWWYSYLLPDLETHVPHVKAVLACLLEHHLYIKVEKCEFHLPQVRFLGYAIGFCGLWRSQLWLHGLTSPSSESCRGL